MNKSCSHNKRHEVPTKFSTIFIVFKITIEMCTHIGSAIVPCCRNFKKKFKNYSPFLHFLLQTYFLEEECCSIFLPKERFLGLPWIFFLGAKQVDLVLMNVPWAKMIPQGDSSLDLIHFFLKQHQMAFSLGQKVPSRRSHWI